MKNPLIDNSKLILCIGEGGTGKTTWMLQMAFNLIKGYKTSEIFQDDIEIGTDIDRVLNITGHDIEYINKVYNYRNDNITLESFFERIFDIYEEKHIHNRDSYIGDDGELEPTVYLVNPLSLLLPKDELIKPVDKRSISNIHSYLTELIRSLIPKLKIANIILIIENHLDERIDININYNNEADKINTLNMIPDATAILYYSDKVLKFDYHDIDNTQITLVKSVDDFNKRIILKLNENGFEKLY